MVTLVLVGAVVIFSRTWNGVAFDDDRLASSGAWSGDTTVEAIYRGDMDAVCDRPENGEAGPGDPAAAGLCVIDIAGTDEGLRKAEFAYVVQLRGTSALDDWIPVLDGLRVFALLIGAGAFLQLLRSGLRGRLFTPGAARSLGVVAGCVAVGAVVTPYLVHRLEDALIDRFVPWPAARALLEPAGTGPGVAPVIGVVSLVVFAGLWRRAALRAPSARAGAA